MPSRSQITDIPQIPENLSTIERKQPMQITGLLHAGLGVLRENQHELSRRHNLKYMTLNRRVPMYI
jgi:hypothetical protein